MIYSLDIRVNIIFSYIIDLNLAVSEFGLNLVVCLYLTNYKTL